MSTPATVPTAGPTTVLPLEGLTALVRDVAADVSCWRSRVRFGSSERWWTRLEAAASYDLWLLTWTTDSTTDLHDHGASTAAFTVVAGALDEVRIHQRTTSCTSTLARTRLPAGTTRWLAPGIVHDVRNRYAVPAVSIHGYSPPLTCMTYYRLRRGRLHPLRVVTSHQPEATLL